MTQLVTLFGASGFIGRYVTQALAARGFRIRVVSRDPRDAWFLQPLGALGQVQALAADVRDFASVARVVQGADAVINLVGVLAGDFQAIHVEGAANVARAASAAGVRHLVHLSAIGADPDSASAYGRSKGQGEKAVTAAFPEATIMRPSVVFGREDQFLNRFANMIATLPIVPVVRAATRFQPVFVGDVAAAVAVAISDQRIGLFYLGGPETVTMQALLARISAMTGRSRPLFALPDGLSSALANGLGWLPGAPITRDQWLMLQADNIVPSGAPDLTALGVPSTPIEAVAPEWLVRYRPQGRFGARIARARAERLMPRG